jgi:hypothetical protein
MAGGAGLYGAVLGPSGGHRGLDRSLDRGLVGGEFALVLAEFRVAADELDQLVDIKLRRRRGEHDQALHSGRFEASRRRRTDTCVPPWLGHAEHEWCARRHHVLADLATAGPTLRDPATCYRRADTCRPTLADSPPGALAERPVTGIPGTRILQACAARGDPDRASHSADGHARVPVDPADPAPGPVPTSLPEALALWRARSSAYAQLTFLPTAHAVALPSWRGDAAEAYEQWLISLTHACSRLHEDAERIHHELAPRPARRHQPGRPMRRPASGFHRRHHRDHAS